ncbi:threonine--tRNA ligase [Bacillus halotolerans]|uniref:threonine--tRNA ligase n=1 Tax=Bacillus TaxID=1386 RepID=UPI00116471FC|nr:MULTISPECIES: threonine--tRNA ligase [Bacillus]MCV0023908.1 threonine--tRNA ligase [Bacillus sp. XT-2]MEC3637657.1 threonine--tRNA ligase [Bacillus halotolerans]QDK67184.1 threonine--tRNA ligase [Bacillus halotolerans]UTL76424.1 threonine--tRNA ligase [Bacillus halotolerans]WJE42841.1 threonine--tRNA ligase [Bacillus halotolerans]
MSKHVSIQLPDGQVKEYPKGTTVKEAAASISSSLEKKAAAGQVNGRLVDVSFKLEEDAELSIITLDSPEGLQVLRHTSAHVLAQAVKRLYGEAYLGIGPVIEDGFYYDMKLDRSLTSGDLEAIEKEMKHIINENMDIKRIEVSYEEAEALFAEKGEPFKLEILKDIPRGEKMTLYQQGEFVDLCRGPHLPSTGMIKAFKLTRVSGAYWRGDSQNEVLQRVYGVAFQKKKDLEAHLHMLEEAAKRDHRKLGKQLELFMFSEEAPGMPFYLPKGQIVRNELERFSRELQTNAGYAEVRTPFMMNQRLWEQSGHWDHYRDNMYFSEVDQTAFAMKPMNCPGHMLIFKNSLYSYRDLPIRMAEFGQVHRHEYSGALNGMLRVRTFCQDDAHIFVREDQIESEIKEAIRLIDEVYRTFGFEYTVELSTRPEDSSGEDSVWEMSENALKHVLEDLGLPYEVNAGDGAFYGAKIDFHIKDALKRSHQCATIQLDFQMPEKFDLTYINEHNEKVRPVVIHRAVFGSIDRFFGILIEHFGGAFPVWLAPVQVQIIPVSHVHMDYCEKVQSELKRLGIRVNIDERNEKLGYKIRESQMQKIPYMLVLGDQEVSEKAVNVRQFGHQKSEQVPFQVFKENIVEQAKNRSM